MVSVGVVGVEGWVCGAAGVPADPSQVDGGAAGWSPCFGEADGAGDAQPEAGGDAGTGALGASPPAGGLGVDCLGLRGVEPDDESSGAADDGGLAEDPDPDPPEEDDPGCSAPGDVGADDDVPGAPAGRSGRRAGACCAHARRALARARPRSWARPARRSPVRSRSRARRSAR